MYFSNIKLQSFRPRYRESESAGTDSLDCLIPSSHLLLRNNQFFFTALKSHHQVSLWRHSLRALLVCTLGGHGVTVNTVAFEETEQTLTTWNVTSPTFMLFCTTLQTM